jgi:quercetin dioxygenase-like cupin family protein
MRNIALISLCLGVAPLAPAADAPTQTITRAGMQPSAVGPEQNFTGRVRVERLVPATPEINASAAYVTFEPGARSAWHTHPKGQHLIVTSGVGRTQVFGEPVQEIRAGDVIWCPPGVKHWHGAAPNTAMTHLTITGQDEQNRNSTWLEKVSDEQYLSR